MNNQVEQAEQAESLIKKTTLGEQGPTLPLGVLGPDALYHKDLAVKPWRMKEERELGALRDANKDSNMARYVSMILGSMCTKIGTHEFGDSAVADAAKQLAIGQMFTPDVFYSYIWLRIQAMGPELVLSLKCPKCPHKIDNYVANLASVEVNVVEKLADACWEYKLQHPVNVRSAEVTHFVLGPTRWNALEMMKGSGVGAAKPAMIKASIHAIGTLEANKEMVLTEGDLDELTKRDIEAMTRLIDKHSIGPNMSIEGKCPACSHEFRMAIDWGYDSFFGDSSQ